MEDKQNRFSPFLRGLLTGAGFGLVCMSCFFLGMRFSTSRQVAASVLDDPLTTDKVRYLEQLVEDNYLYDTKESDLSEGIFAGLLYGLGDPYSAYYTAEDYQAELELDEGAYVGLGIVFYKSEEGQGIIDEVYKGSPAEDAGLQVDDEIWQVNGKDVITMEADDIVSEIRGSEKAELVIHRPSTGEELELTIELRAVELSSVETQMLEDGVGYLRILQFTNQTPSQFEAGMNSLRDEGMTKLIVDLRGNPGGLLNSVCDVLRQVLPEGLIVYMEDKYGRQDTFSCDGTKELDLPMAVLINGMSASAAEIFAGAVQDYGKGTIVGTKSYGKGVVQSIISLVDGSAVKLTTAQYFTPKGNIIQDKGVTPDVVVKVGPDDDAAAFPDKDTQLAEALRVLGSKGEEAEEKAEEGKEEVAEEKTEEETEETEEETEEEAEEETEAEEEEETKDSEKKENTPKKKDREIKKKQTN